MVAVNTSGSLTATAGGTEDTLATVTDAGVYQLVVDAAAMTDGDSVTLRVYGKARSSDAERVLYESTFANLQGWPLKASVAVPSPHYFKATLTQTAGSARAFPWAVYSL
jgi:hypothetical protein